MAAIEHTSGAIATATASAADHAKPQWPQTGGTTAPPGMACRKASTTVGAPNATATCSLRSNKGNGNSSNCNSNSSGGPNAVTTTMTGAFSWQRPKQAASAVHPGIRASSSTTPCCSSRPAWNAAIASAPARTVAPRFIRTKPPAFEGAATAAHSAAAVPAVNARSEMARPATPQPRLQQYTSLKLISLPVYATAESPEYIDWMHMDVDAELEALLPGGGGALVEDSPIEELWRTIILDVNILFQVRSDAILAVEAILRGLQR
ncbi:hypothetical protein Vretimale_9579 [Volvox reticuliferus]|uniref:Uncharacterized protein n=2 Tax=Volvox reticuliferus TaxID=1737510 RepID=A0A8J4LQ48_9CHLO|nr:hypothetical protein Vretimale_9579 [Volvox reticuliferus]